MGTQSTWESNKRYIQSNICRGFQKEQFKTPSITPIKKNNNI